MLTPAQQNQAEEYERLFDLGLATPKIRAEVNAAWFHVHTMQDSQTLAGLKASFARLAHCQRRAMFCGEPYPETYFRHIIADGYRTGQQVNARLID